MEHNRELGRIGELEAQKYLKENGYKIIETNYRCPLGEIDIIAKDKGELVFIEVKTRTSKKYGSPIEAINKKKQNSIMKSAQFYLNRKNLNDVNVRFDAVEVIINNSTTVEITKGIMY